MNVKRKIHFANKENQIISFQKLFLTSLLVIVLFPLIFPSSNQIGEIQVEPNKLIINTDTNEIKGETELSFILFSNTNMTKIDIHVVDLYESENNHTPISADLIKINPNSFSIKENEIKKIRLTLDGTTIEPGKYEGKILIFGEGTKTEVPINLIISTSSFIPLIPLILGIGANFTLKHTKRMMSLKDTIDQKFEEFNSTTWSEAIKRITNKELNTEICEGIKLWSRSKEKWKIGRYDLAKKFLEYAENKFKEGFKNDKDPQAMLPNVPELRQYLQGNQIDNEPLEPPTSESFIKGTTRMRDVWVFIGLTITLGVSVITIWQNYLSQTVAFGSSGFDYIAAFLFAFGSQALLGESLDISSKN